jgi:hypothetical protein
MKNDLNTIDTLGTLLAQIADLEKQASAIKDDLKDSATAPGGSKVFEGDLFKATVVESNRSTIDWKQFIGQAPWHDFSLERFFRWRCWWDYSTGLSGDLLTHEYDSINQIMGVGIPDSVVILS